LLGGAPLLANGLAQKGKHGDNSVSTATLAQHTYHNDSGTDTQPVQVGTRDELNFSSQSVPVTAPVGNSPAGTISGYIYDTLDDLEGSATEAYDINNAGQIVGYFENSAGFHGFLYSGGNYTTLDDPLATGISTTASGIPFVAPPLTVAVGINSTGAIAGYYEDRTGFTRGFIYSDGGYHSLNDPLATITGTFDGGINDAGKVVGTYENPFGVHGFVFSSQNGLISYTNIDALSAGITFANGINDTDQVVGEYYEGNDFGSSYHGFLYDGSSYIRIDDPSATHGTDALGINNSGQIVGTYSDSSGNHAFLYNSGSYITLNDPRATGGTNANGVNDAGQIVGSYSDNGGTHGFVATPVTGARVTIGAGEALEVTSASSGTVAFSGATGVLQLDNSQSFSGTVAGMTGQDTIDFADIDPTRVQPPSYFGDASGGTLTLSDGSRTANIALIGNYLASSFVASSDGHGGTSVVDPPTGMNQPLATQPYV
jgi:probable HAF family extracellular repeat protein